MNLGGWEIILILALVLILFGARKLPELTKGLGRGLFEFRKRIDDESAEAGRSLGGIYGKPAAEAITTDNQVAELYDPAVLDKELPPHKRSNTFLKLLSKWCHQLLQLLRCHAHLI
jgi:sec-independent protein translocase protein TatA